jgi:hypothetical protein
MGHQQSLSVQVRLLKTAEGAAVKRFPEKEGSIAEEYKNACCCPKMNQL